MELTIILGLFGLGALLYILFTKVFPIMEVKDCTREDASLNGKLVQGNGPGRKRAFLLTLLVGIALAVTGFLLSAPLGPTAGPMYSEPRVLFAPLMFVAGIIITILSPVVYELYPYKRGENKEVVNAS